MYMLGFVCIDHLQNMFEIALCFRKDFCEYCLFQKYSANGLYEVPLESVVPKLNSANFLNIFNDQKKTRVKVHYL